MTWLAVPSYLGLPRWGWLLVLAVMAIESILGRSQNPKLRSSLSATLTLLTWILSLVPGAGPILAKILERKPADPSPPAPPPPPTGAAILILAAGLALSACSHIPAPPPIVDGVVDCTIVAVKEAAINLLPAVSSALASGDWQAELTKLVLKAGAAAVDCAVARVGSEAAADAKLARTDALAPIKAEHARAWLQQQGVTIRGG